MAALNGYLALGSLSGGTFTEISGATGYARQAITLVENEFDRLTNSNKVQFTKAAGSSWPTFNAYGLYLVPGGGAPIQAWATRVPDANDLFGANPRTVDIDGLGQGIAQPLGNKELVATGSDKARALSDIAASGLRNRPQIIATNGHMMVSLTASDANTNHDVRMGHKTGAAGASRIQFVYGNFYANNTDTEGPSSFVLRAGLEVPAGIFGGTARAFKCRFNGQETITLAPGMIAVTDPIDIYIPPDTTIQSRTNMTFTAGQQQPRGPSLGLTSSCGARDTLAHRAYGTGFYAGNAIGFSPLGVIGVADRPSPAVIIWGDSNGDGSGDVTPATVPNGTWYGFIPRALGDVGGVTGRVVPYVRLTKGGAAIGGHNTPEAGYLRKTMFQYASTLISQSGRNDVNGGSTPAATLAQLQLLWSEAKARGIREVIQTGIFTTTTSTDSWATEANQTPTAYSVLGGTRDQLNALLAAEKGKGLLDDFVPSHLDVENPATNKWLVAAGGAITSDGVHLGGAGDGHGLGATRLRARAASFLPF